MIANMGRLAIPAILIGLAGFLAAPAALADDPNYTPPHVDNAYPHTQPAYPDAAQLAGEEGTVVVNVQVMASGHIRQAIVIGSSGHNDLDNLALAAVLGWHFTPAVKYGDTESDWVKQTIVFRLPRAAPSALVAPPPATH